MTINQLSEELSNLVLRYGSTERVMTVIANKTMTHRPCYQCESREVGCHSNCKNYMQYKWANEYLKGLRKSAIFYKKF